MGAIKTVPRKPRKCRRIYILNLITLAQLLEGEWLMEGRTQINQGEQ